ncbi:hypothetical protein J6590_098702, partial [Homalodisca vitripennis]
GASEFMEVSPYDYLCLGSIREFRIALLWPANLCAGETNPDTVSSHQGTVHRSMIKVDVIKVIKFLSKSMTLTSLTTLNETLLLCSGIIPLPLLEFTNHQRGAANPKTGFDTQ